jgi:hypothetical protein
VLAIILSLAVTALAEIKAETPDARYGVLGVISSPTAKVGIVVLRDLVRNVSMTLEVGEALPAFPDFRISSAERSSRVVITNHKGEISYLVPAQAEYAQVEDVVTNTSTTPSVMLDQFYRGFEGPLWADPPPLLNEGERPKKSRFSLNAPFGADSDGLGTEIRGIEIDYDNFVEDEYELEADD